MYAIIENNKVVEFPILSIHQRFSNVSFPAVVTAADLPDGVVRVHPVAPPAYEPAAHKPVQAAAPVLANERWELGYTLVALNAQEIQERSDVAAAQVRQERNDKLISSDWTQVADAPVDRQAWAAYRQALRNISSQPGFPYNVSWPSQP